MQRGPWLVGIGVGGFGAGLGIAASVSGQIGVEGVSDINVLLFVAGIALAAIGFVAIPVGVFFWVRDARGPTQADWDRLTRYWDEAKALMEKWLPMVNQRPDAFLIAYRHWERGLVGFSKKRFPESIWRFIAMENEYPAPHGAAAISRLDMQIHRLHEHCEGRGPRAKGLDS